MANLTNKYDPLISSLITASDTPHFERLRDIENHYHLTLIATSSDQIMKFQAASLRLQASQASQVAATMTNAVAQQAIAIDLLTDISYGIDTLNETAYEILVSVKTLNESVRIGFERTAELLFRQHKELETISVALRNPDKTKALEHRTEGEKWLKEGMLSADETRGELGGCNEALTPCYG